MLNKEEIEEVKKEINIITTTVRKILQKNVKITDEAVYKLDGRQYLAIENALQYIEQLETKEQKLIEMLEEDIETAKKKNTPYAECKKERRMYLMNTGKIQAEERILKIVKGENDE